MTAALAELAAHPGLVERVHRALRDAIGDGTLAPGARVTQEDLAGRLAVSRQPVLQALRLLKQEGLVLDAPGRGLRVAPLDAERIADVYEVRAALDSLAARLAAHRRATLGPQLLERGRRAARGRDIRAMVEADEAFHLVERHGNVDVLSSPSRDDWPRRIPKELRAALRTLPLYGPLDEASARQLGVVLGISSAHLAAAFGQESDPQEAVVAGWRGGPGLSHGAMKAVAEMTGAARAILESQRQTVDAILMRERTRFAYEIHDGLTQAVTTAVLELEALGHQIEQDPRGAALTLSTTKAEIRKSLSELRGLLYDLSREDRGPAVASEEPLMRYVNDVVRRWRLPAHVSVEGNLQDLPKPVLGAAYVVVREALANAAKHAGAGKVTVLFKATPEGLNVEVGDSGRGFSTPVAGADEPHRHFGLEMMRKRVAEVGGTLDVRSAPGEGTRVHAHLPVGGERSEGPDR